MADQPVVHIGENSPEEVAFKLFCRIGFLEKKTDAHGFIVSGGEADRRYILDTYAECLEAAKGFRSPQEGFDRTLERQL